MPSLGIIAIKAKLDTGARTSALHAWDMKVHTVDGQKRISFRVHPMEREKEKSVLCEAQLLDQRWITNSSGMGEHRYIISTDLQIGTGSWPIELSLTNREAMGFTMIIGREAMRNRLIVDPRASFRAGRNHESKANEAFDDADDPETGGVIK